MFIAASLLIGLHILCASKWDFKKYNFFSDRVRRATTFFGQEKNNAAFENSWNGLEAQEGRYITKEFMLPENILRLDCGGAGNLIFEFGTANYVSITCDENIIKSLEPESCDETLYLNRKKILSRLPMTYYVTLKKMKHCSVEDSMLVQMPHVTVDKLALSAFNNARFHLSNVSIGSLQINLFDNAACKTINGSFDTFYIFLKNNAYYYAENTTSRYSVVWSHDRVDAHNIINYSRGVHLTPLTKQER